MPTGAPTHALIVGGGTAGHVLPGIAIGQELVRRGHDANTIHFVGSERGVERGLVPDAGFDLTVLPGRGIQRRLTLDNVSATVGLVRAFVQAFRIVRTRRPNVVVALGGYASVPAGAWAVLFRVPIVVAEQNAVPGLANRLIARFAKSSAVSYERTGLPREVWTGNPVRPEILEVAERSADQRASARAQLGIDAEQTLVVVFGGSLGARRINDAVVAALPNFSSATDLTIRHIIGSRDHAEVLALVPADLGELIYQPIEYEHHMAQVFAAADLVVCRAGATSCAELAVTGTPALLVPLPGAPGDHQTANARALEQVGGARLVPDSQFTAELFVRSLTELLDSPETLAEMGDRARSIARPDAASAVVDLVERHAAEPRS
ncbi:MAG: undecaprenyldiphospho-muramoylpentapeptide beta-N-acetylglucosaminyltransferase [Acidimicrobiales bacterium]